MSATSLSGGPVFLAGLSHSGKTELRRALEGLPDFSWRRKTYLWLRHHDRYGDLTHQAAQRRCLAALADDPEIAARRVDLCAVAADLRSPHPTYSGLFAKIHEREAVALGCSRWGVQAGMIEAFAEPILQTLPDARFVHLVRDPHDALAGLQGRALGWELARWCFSAAAAIDHRARWPERYLVVRYEELMAEPQRLTSAVCDVIGAHWHRGIASAVVGDRDRASGRGASGPNRVAGRQVDQLRAQLGYRTGLARHRRGPRSDVPAALAMTAWRGTEGRALARSRGRQPLRFATS